MLDTDIVEHRVKHLSRTILFTQSLSFIDTTLKMCFDQIGMVLSYNNNIVLSEILRIVSHAKNDNKYHADSVPCP